MEKEKLVQCVPIEMMERLKKLLARLWEDNNPAGVHLGAIMDEFESDIKSLNGVVKEYENDFSGRLKFVEDEYKEKVETLEADLADYKTRMSGLDKSRGENSRKLAELNDALKRKEGEMAAFRVQLAEEEAQLNSKYVAKMQELYDRVSRKDLDMLSRWEEKNKALESKYGALEADYNGKARQFKLREQAMTEEFNSRKEELIMTFDRIRLELDAREEDLSAREEKLAELEKKTRQEGL